MEKEQVNPRRIKLVGRNLIAIFIVSIAYVILATLINQSNISQTGQLVSAHYGLASICGLFNLLFFISICYHLIRCTAD